MRPRMNESGPCVVRASLGTHIKTHQNLLSNGHNRALLSFDKCFWKDCRLWTWKHDTHQLHSIKVVLPLVVLHVWCHKGSIWVLHCTQLLESDASKSFFFIHDFLLLLTSPGTSIVPGQRGGDILNQKRHWLVIVATEPPLAIQNSSRRKLLAIIVCLSMVKYEYC